MKKRKLLMKRECLSAAALEKLMVPNVQLTRTQFDALRCVLGSRPEGEVWFHSVRAMGAICLACGARDKQRMMRTHKRACPFVSYGKAIDVLKALVNSPGSAK